MRETDTDYNSLIGERRGKEKSSVLEWELGGGIKK